MPNQLTSSSSTSLSSATTLQAVPATGGGEGNSLFVLGSSQPISENDASLAIATFIAVSEETSGSLLPSSASSDVGSDPLDDVSADDEDLPSGTAADDDTAQDLFFANFDGGLLDDLVFDLLDNLASVP